MTLAQARTYETTTDQILAEQDGHILTLTLNRPERLNAISGPMLADFSRLLTQANRDPEIRCVILTGAGRGFCSGLDLVDNNPDARSGRNPPPEHCSTCGTRRQQSSGTWTSPSSVP